jgi:hypothetical protein
MSYILRYDSDADCVFLSIEGLITTARIREIVPKIERLCETSACWRVLGDVSDASIDLSGVKFLRGLKILDESNVTCSIKRALVAPSLMDYSASSDTVSDLRSKNLSVFGDVETAMQWLLKNRAEQMSLFDALAI